MHYYVYEIAVNLATYYVILPYVRTLATKYNFGESSYRKATFRSLL